MAAVFAGGLAGGLARYLITEHWPSRSGTLPWAILAINTAGAFLLALLLVLLSQLGAPTAYLRPLVGTGFLGAFTTFSSVTVGVTRLAEDGQPATAAVYLFGGTAAGLAAAVAGLLLGRAVFARRSGVTRRAATGGAPDRSHRTGGPR